MKEEREIGKIRGTRDLPMGVFVSEVLAVMLARLAGEDWSTKPHAEKRLAVGQLFLADVLYLFLYLRREAIGTEVQVGVACNACKRRSFTADLDTRSHRGRRRRPGGLVRDTWCWPWHRREVRKRSRSAPSVGASWRAWARTA